LADSATVPALVHIAGHDISSLLGKQLVLELKRGKASAEVVDGLPSCVVFRQPFPLDKHVPDTATKLTTERPIRSVKNSAIVHRWQSRCRCRRRAPEWLQDAHMEYIMDAGAFGQPEAISCCTHALHHLKGSSKTRTELAAETRDERLCWPMKDAEQHPIVDLKLQRPVMSIIMLLGIYS